MKIGFVLLIFALLLAADAWAQSDLNALTAGAKNDKEVVWYTTTSAGDNQAIVAGFNKRYPFLKVQVLRSTGEKLRQRVLAETQGGQFFSDVLSVSSMEMGLLKSRNLLQPYDPPEADAYPANARDKEKAFTAIYARNFVMGYNTAMLSDKERPRDWSDLLAPFWKGKFAMDEEEFEWFGTLVDYWGREKAGKFIRALAAQQPQLRRGHSLLAQLLAAGEFPRRHRFSVRDRTAQTKRRAGRLGRDLRSDRHLDQRHGAVDQGAPCERRQAADQLRLVRRRPDHHQESLPRADPPRRQTDHRQSSISRR